VVHCTAEGGTVRATKTKRKNIKSDWTTQKGVLKLADSLVLGLQKAPPRR
jgi:hypothetical protein